MSSAQYSGNRWEIHSQLEIRYQVREVPNLLDPENPVLGEAPSGTSRGGRRLVVVDHSVARLYGERIKRYFVENGIGHMMLELSGNERHKTMGQVFQVISALNDLGTLRVSDPPIAIGGGVVLDVVGLATSLYRRGIPQIRIPTTLLSLIDVSVAAKTGVNFQGYRNRIGSYSPPPLTLIDTSFLRTVSSRQISNGAGEMLKMGLIKDAALFALLEADGPEMVRRAFQGPATAREAIRRAISGMIDELRGNLWEKNLQRAVDHGHSFSPLVEMRHLPELLHGEAVTLDCILSAVIAGARGYLTQREIERVVHTAAGLRLPVWHRGFADAALLWESLSDTTRHRNGEQNLPIMAGIGQVAFLYDVTFREVADAVEVMQELAGSYGPRRLDETAGT